MTIKAVYEKGVFRPLEDVRLAENTPVEVTLPTAETVDDGDVVRRQQKLWELLGRRFDGGDPQVSEKHNEHQP